MQLPKARFLDFLGFPGYIVTSNGDIWKWRSGDKSRGTPPMWYRYTTGNTFYEVHGFGNAFSASFMQNMARASAPSLLKSQRKARSLFRAARSALTA